MSDILSKLRAFYENAETDECLADIREAIGELERFYAEPGWIPVEESKPCHGDTVWVYDGKDVFMGEWWGQSGFQSYGSSCDREGLNSETLLGVTHWMEIDEPEPPV